MNAFRKWKEVRSRISLSEMWQKLDELTDLWHDTKITSKLLR
jgi:hypothetical protein